MAKRPNQYVEAALKVLEASREPMTTQAITDEALHRKLLDVTGKTPEASMGAQLYTSIKRLRGRSPFEQVGPGLFMLRGFRGREKAEPEEPADQKVPRAGGSIFAALGLFWSKADVDWTGKKLLTRFWSGRQG